MLFEQNRKKIHIFAASLNQQATGQNPADIDSFCPLHGGGSTGNGCTAST